MPKELKGYDLLDDKEVRQAGKIIMPIPQSDIYAYTDLFFDPNDNLLVYYKYDAEDTKAPVDCILRLNGQKCCSKVVQSLILSTFAAI